MRETGFGRSGAPGSPPGADENGGGVKDGASHFVVFFLLDFFLLTMFPFNGARMSANT